MFPGKEGELECKRCQTTSVSEGTPTVVAERVNKEIVIMEEADGILPTTDAKCPKCGHGKAEWQSRQMRAADEAPTRIYRCVECRHTWREND
jgi:DNA-directed RNA polymerase subunit M